MDFVRILHASVKAKLSGRSTHITNNIKQDWSTQVQHIFYTVFIGLYSPFLQTIFAMRQQTPKEVQIKDIKNPSIDMKTIFHIESKVPICVDIV